ncbi:MAG: FecR domain-containing protein [Armatimonadetes bacterium]|nr:FecR domain-containing protein [Armatimonadota bacterium]
MIQKMFCAALVALLVPLPAAHAQSPKPKTANQAVIADAFGSMAKRKGTGSFFPMTLPLRKTTLLFGGEAIHTGADSALLLTFGGDRVLRVGANSTVAIGDDGVSLHFKVLAGQAWVFSPGGGIQLSTPSAIVTATGNTLLGVGHDPAIDSTQVSMNAGSANVSLASGGWKGVANGGQIVRYLRTPRRNIRLRAPQVAPQTDAHEAMWKRLRAEPWTRGKPGKLARGIEGDLQVLLPPAKGSKP